MIQKVAGVGRAVPFHEASIPMALRLLAIAAGLPLLIGCGQNAPVTPQQLVQQGNYDQAIEACTRALRANPRDAEAYLYRGRAYHCRNAEGDLSRAIADFSESILQDPKNSEAYYSRALAYRDQGQSKPAESDEQLARQLDPRIKEVYAQLPEYTAPPPKPGADPEAATAEKSKEAADEPSLIKPVEDELQEFQRLKKRFEPLSAHTANDAEAPVDPTLELLKKPTFRLPSEATDGEHQPEPAAPPGGGSAGAGPPRAAGAPGRTESGAATPRPAASPLETLPPASPWRRRDSAAPAPIPSQPYGGSTLYPGVTALPRSPFPQRAPSPTGYVEPSSPFAQQPQRVQARPLYNNAPYNPQTVRPFGAYHSDYNP
jgi:hypothetical protein